MRIPAHARWHRHAGVRVRTCAHGKSARGIAGQATAGSNAQFRRARHGGQTSGRGRLRLHGKQFALCGACQRNNHPRHFISDIERALLLCRLHSAFAGSFHLIERLRLEMAAVGRAAPGDFLQFLFHRIVGIGRRCSRSGRLVATQRSRNDRQDGKGFSHDAPILSDEGSEGEFCRSGFCYPSCSKFRS
jgi:hypothetical protein